MNMSGKTLLIMRHAKAEGMSGSKYDFNREIINIGEKRTLLVAEKLILRGVIPECIITSPAARALQTAKLMAKSIKLSNDKIIKDESLYFKTLNDYFNALYSAPEEYSTILIMGHNPLVSSFANFFLTKQEIILPTSGLISIKSKADNWSEFVIASNNLMFSLFPKNIENEESINS